MTHRLLVFTAVWFWALACSGQSPASFYRNHSLVKKWKGLLGVESHGFAERAGDFGQRVTCTVNQKVLGEISSSETSLGPYLRWDAYPVIRDEPLNAYSQGQLVVHQELNSPASQVTLKALLGLAGISEQSFSPLLPDTYAVGFDNATACTSLLVLSNGHREVGPGVCSFGPKDVATGPPYVGQGLVKNISRPKEGLTLTGRVQHQDSPASCNVKSDITWKFECDSEGVLPVSRMWQHCDSGSLKSMPALRQVCLSSGAVNWWSHRYANSSDSIGLLACALTTLAMALKYAGLDTDPGRLNQTMIQKGGYSGKNIVFDLAVRRASSGALKFIRVSGKNSKDVEDALCMGFPFAVKANDHHYVLITGKQGVQFTINDPAYGRTTLDPDYSGTWESRGFIVPAKSRIAGARSPFVRDLIADDSSVIISSDQNIRTTVLDSNGRRTSPDASEIPFAVYASDLVAALDGIARPEDTTHSISIDRPASGRYDVILTADRAVNFSTTVHIFDINSDERPSIELQASAYPGSAAFTLNLNASPGANSTASPIGCAWSTLHNPVFTSNAGSGTIQVNSAASCNWSVSSEAAWIVPGISSSQGPGNVSFQVLANSGGTRTGIIRVGGVPHRITQRKTAPQFRDVAVGDIYFDAANILLARGVTRGCSSAPDYCPQQSVTRGQMAAFLVRALVGDSFTYPQQPYFTDVPSSHEFFRYIQKLKEIGITTGCSANTYCPNDAVSRWQMAIFLVRAKLGASTVFTGPVTAYFDDVNAFHPNFVHIQKLRELGITAGCSTRDYCPENPVTRGQMALFLVRTFFPEPGI